MERHSEYNINVSRKNQNGEKIVSKRKCKTFNFNINKIPKAAQTVMFFGTVGVLGITSGLMFQNINKEPEKIEGVSYENPNYSHYEFMSQVESQINKYHENDTLEQEFERFSYADITIKYEVKPGDTIRGIILNYDEDMNSVLEREKQLKDDNDIVGDKIVSNQTLTLKDVPVEYLDKFGYAVNPTDLSLDEKLFEEYDFCLNQFYKIAISGFISEDELDLYEEIKANCEEMYSVYQMMDSGVEKDALGECLLDEYRNLNYDILSKGLAPVPMHIYKETEDGYELYCSIYNYKNVVTYEEFNLNKLSAGMSL